VATHQTKLQVAEKQSFLTQIQSVFSAPSANSAREKFFGQGRQGRTSQGLRRPNRLKCGPFLHLLSQLCMVFFCRMAVTRLFFDKAEKKKVESRKLKFKGKGLKSLSLRLSWRAIALVTAAAPFRGSWSKLMLSR
jgi:hypothetical protein